MSAILDTRHAAMSFLNSIATNPAYHDYLAVLKGARNGAVYGAKVRFPHALVMAILFGRGTWRQRLRGILEATKEHAINLGTFVGLYKAIMLLQRKLHGGKERNADTFIAGLLAGYTVSDRSNVNEQIVLYVVSRVIASFLPREYPINPPKKNVVRPLPPDRKSFSIFAAVVWGAIMWLFKNRAVSIQPGMFSAMSYLYHDSEVWVDFRTLFWHNK